jgi:hypothetical protein
MLQEISTAAGAISTAIALELEPAFGRWTPPPGSEKPDEDQVSLDPRPCSPPGYAPGREERTFAEALTQTQTQTHPGSCAGRNRSARAILDSP